MTTGGLPARANASTAWSSGGPGRDHTPVTSTVGGQSAGRGTNVGLSP